MKCLVWNAHVSNTCCFSLKVITNWERFPQSQTIEYDVLVPFQYLLLVSCVWYNSICQFVIQPPAYSPSVLMSFDLCLLTTYLW